MIYIKFPVSLSFPLSLSITCILSSLTESRWAQQKDLRNLLWQIPKADPFRITPASCNANLLDAPHVLNHDLCRQLWPFLLCLYVYNTHTRMKEYVHMHALLCVQQHSVNCIKYVIICRSYGFARGLCACAHSCEFILSRTHTYGFAYTNLPFHRIYLWVPRRV